MPSIFSRFTDIISANINAMLDRAENPEKMIKLIIGEMEDTLVELKAACAQTMAQEAQLGRAAAEARAKVELWGSRAQLAVDKGRDDLAREALLEKRALARKLESIERERAETAALVAKYKNEIGQLEEKLNGAKEKERLLVQRHKRAQSTLKARTQSKKYDQAEAARLKFSNLESRIDRLDAEADLAAWPGEQPAKPGSARDLEREFEILDDAIERELQTLKGAPPEAGPRT